MSIIRCDKHDLNWDSDKLENCPLCANSTRMCKGKNCTSTDGTNHSPECVAEHEATIDGITPPPAAPTTVSDTPETDALLSASPNAELHHDDWYALINHAKLLERQRNALRAPPAQAGDRVSVPRSLIDECLRWHHGDKWREGNTAQRESWETHQRKLADALSAAPSPQSEGWVPAGEVHGGVAALVTSIWLADGTKLYAFPAAPSDGEKRG